MRTDQTICVPSVAKRPDPVRTTKDEAVRDVIVIGGSYAGLSAALQLARARRRVLVIDAGLPRNRFAQTSHGFLTHDGTPPGEIAARGREQLLAYPTVEWMDGEVISAEKTNSGFSITLADGKHHDARRLVLALGVADELPTIRGLAERWGSSVFHCPYCHGYELNQGKIGVIATSPMSMHHALMLPDWGPTTFFLNGAFTPDSEQTSKLLARRITIESEAIAKITGQPADVELQDGRVIELAGLFVATRTLSSSPLASQLGCALEEGPMGPFIQTNVFKETSVLGVFACGDVARPAGSVAFSVADGAMAGAATHQSLFMR